MFNSLPTEIKLDIFKCLNFEDLCSIKQTNLYFYNFLNKYEGELAREEFNKILIGDIEKFKEGPHKIIRPNAKDFGCTRCTKCNRNPVLVKPIPLYLSDRCSNKIVICLTKVYNDEEHQIILELPTIIKNKNQMKIVYYYLNKLFKCFFKCGDFEDFIFNPELIQLLFGNS
uniref:F-box domain-containing protein n=1 Tax=Meloidogyne enterolobii TaxID=390850 RepID=A0A6V7TYF3_MELEN|nr:unnamed protein product [Meloidogyne enterolobii]